MEELDTYSNILYVMGKGGKLAQIAQKYFALDPNRPEVCCLVGELCLPLKYFLHVHILTLRYSIRQSLLPAWRPSKSNRHV
jgi:hypothetical protein